MANTFSQLNIQAIYAVYGRQNLLTSNIRNELFRYTNGILRRLNIFPLSVGGYKDHVHIFFELPVSIPVSKVLQGVKANSSKWINDRGFYPNKFEWQKGYGAFSYSRSQRNNVIQYIMNQEEHHKRKTFREEYLEFLDRFEVEFDKKYLFEFYE